MGYRTRKILYLGVKNKFCIMYETHKSKGTDVPEHTCFKNWSGSSSAMEADIIAKGFRISESTFGLRYTKFIGDGDSSW